MVEKINERCFGPANHNPMYPAQKTHKKQQWGQTRMALPLSEVGPLEPSSQVATQGRLSFGWLPQQWGPLWATPVVCRHPGPSESFESAGCLPPCPPGLPEVLHCFASTGALPANPPGGLNGRTQGWHPQAPLRRPPWSLCCCVLRWPSWALRRPTQEPFQQALVPLVQQHVGSNLVIVGIFPFVGQQIISACYSSSDFDFSITLTNFDNIKNLQV